MTSSDESTPTRRHRRPRSWAASAVMTAALIAAPSMAAASPSPDADPVVARGPIEALRLNCEVEHAHVDSSADPVYGVRCRWSVPTAGNAAGVRLLRVIVGQGTPRTQVFATRDLHDNTHFDAPLRPDHRYAYRVQALSSNGRIVSSSRTVTVAVSTHDVEPLRLRCEAADGAADETRVHIGCRWTVPTEHRARSLTLWRSVDGGARERVVSFDQPFASSYRDVVTVGTSRVVYAVIATTGDGSIVARSRAEVVTVGDGGRPPIGRLARATGLDRKGLAD